MSTKYSSNTEKLQNAGLLLNQILANAEIEKSLLEFGISKDHVLALKTLYDQTTALFEKQKKEYGEQYESTKLFNQLRSESEAQYNKTLKLARITFRNNSIAASSLLLDGERKENFLDWYNQTTTFYNGLLANEELQKKLSQFGYTDKKLASEKEQIAKTYEAYVAQNKETGEAVKATEERDKKFDELNQQISDLRTVVKIALESKTELKKAIGI